MKFLGFILRNRPAMLSLFAAACRLVIALIRAGTIEAEFCQLFCLEVQFSTLGFQLVDLVRSCRAQKASKASRAEFKKEREIMEFWSMRLLADIQEWHALEIGGGSWDEKQAAEKRYNTTRMRYEIECTKIITKWNRELAKLEAK